MDGPEPTSPLCLRIHRNKLWLSEQQPRLKGIALSAHGLFPTPSVVYPLCHPFLELPVLVCITRLVHAELLRAAKIAFLGVRDCLRDWITRCPRQRGNIFVAMDVNTTETTYSTLKSDPRIPQPVDTRVRQVVVEISQIGVPAFSGGRECLLRYGRVGE